MFYLLAEIADHAIDLLEHGLREDLDFDANFHRGDLPAGDNEAIFRDCFRTRDALAERSVTSAGDDPPPRLLARLMTRDRSATPV